MKRHHLIESILVPLWEITWVIGIFFFAYYLRSITDGIPFMQLPIPYISSEQFLPFILSGAFFWLLVFATGWLYQYIPGRPLFEEIRQVIWRSSIWFLLYIGFVYLSSWFLFSREIPRLIILYVWVLSTIFSIFIRTIFYTVMGILYSRGILEKNKILIIGTWETENYTFTKSVYTEYLHIESYDRDRVSLLIREKEVDTVLFLDHDTSGSDMQEVVRLCTIYGIGFAYPKILSYVSDISRHDTFIGGIAVVESIALSISVWERILKRGLDIIISLLSLTLLSPLFILIAILIKFEDPSGPVIYRNRRIWLSGKEFFLYKFRYMQWKYCVKDSYGIKKQDDSALQYEEELKKASDSRKWPLYKIADDPRKTRVWAVIEKLSLDELPQLWNVLIGNMSLVGPRPHQPREVALYEEHHYQVLTTKPGITGMAQVYGREKNSFEEEVGYDTYYIEHYSIILDAIIVMKTFLVVLTRAFR